MSIACSIEAYNTDSLIQLHFLQSGAGDFQIELFHDQLPLAVPCYDLVPVTELTLSPAKAEISGTPGSLDLTGGEYKT